MNEYSLNFQYCSTYFRYFQWMYVAFAYVWWSLFTYKKDTSLVAWWQGWNRTEKLTLFLIENCPVHAPIESCIDTNPINSLADILLSFYTWLRGMFIYPAIMVWYDIPFPFLYAENNKKNIVFAFGRIHISVSHTWNRLHFHISTRHRVGNVIG